MKILGGTFAYKLLTYSAMGWIKNKLHQLFIRNITILCDERPMTLSGFFWILTCFLSKLICTDNIAVLNRSLCIFSKCNKLTHMWNVCNCKNRRNIFFSIVFNLWAMHCSQLTQYIVFKIAHAWYFLSLQYSSNYYNFSNRKALHTCIRLYDFCVNCIFFSFSDHYKVQCDHTAWITV